MATVNTILKKTVPAAVDLSAAQYTLVKYDANGNLIPAGEGDTAFVLEDNPKAGVSGTITLVGVTKCLAGAPVAAGQRLASDPAGRVIPTDSGDAIVGLCLEPGVLGDIVELLAPASGFAP